MNHYEIFHPVGGAFNTHCVSGQFQYEKVATVIARTVEQAFFLSQNDFNDNYAFLGVRSTSVGDIIALAGDNVYGTYGSEKIPMLVKNTGFQPVSTAWIRYIDWTNKPVVS